jgi:hypothetical protein
MMEALFLLVSLIKSGLKNRAALAVENLVSLAKTPEDSKINEQMLFPARLIEVCQWLIRSRLMN